MIFADSYARLLSHQIWHIDIFRDEHKLDKYKETQEQNLSWLFFIYAKKIIKLSTINYTTAPFAERIHFLSQLKSVYFFLGTVVSFINYSFHTRLCSAFTLLLHFFITGFCRSLIYFSLWHGKYNWWKN